MQTTNWTLNANSVATVILAIATAWNAWLIFARSRKSQPKLSPKQKTAKQSPFRRKTAKDLLKSAVGLLFISVLSGILLIYQNRQPGNVTYHAAIIVAFSMGALLFAVLAFIIEATQFSIERKLAAQYDVILEIITALHLSKEKTAHLKQLLEKTLK